MSNTLAGKFVSNIENMSENNYNGVSYILIREDAENRHTAFHELPFNTIKAVI